MRIDRMMEIRIALIAVAAMACGPPPKVLVVQTVAATTPRSDSIPAAVLSMDQIVSPTRPVAPLVLPRSAETNRISLTATNADVRELIPVLAQAAGISLVMTPDVRGRVNVYLRDVTALDALRAVIKEAGLTVGEDEIPQPFPSAVFYNLPVNINTASAAVIKARFGVSDPIARWIVQAR